MENLNEIRQRLILAVRAVDEIKDWGLASRQSRPEVQALTMTATGFAAAAAGLLADLLLTVDLLSGVAANSPESLQCQYYSVVSPHEPQPPVSAAKLREGLLANGICEEAITTMLEETTLVLLTHAEGLINLGKEKLAQVLHLNCHVVQRRGEQRHAFARTDWPDLSVDFLHHENLCTGGHSTCKPDHNGLCACGFPCE